MEVLSESIVMPVTADVAEVEVRRYLHERATRRPEEPDQAIDWLAGDDAFALGEVRFRSLRNDWTLVIVNVRYDPSTLCRIGADEAALRRLVQRQLQDLRQPLADDYRHRHRGVA